MAVPHRVCGLCPDVALRYPLALIVALLLWYWSDTLSRSSALYYFAGKLQLVFVLSCLY